MAAFEKLKHSLAATGLYSLQDDSLVTAEISALGVAVDMFKDEHKNIVNEDFVHLCSNETLKNTAVRLGLTQISDDALYDVLTVLKRCRFHGVYAEHLKKMLSAMGYEVSISLDETSGKTIIRCDVENSAKFAQDEGVEQLLELIFFDKSRFFIDNSLENAE